MKKSEWSDKELEELLMHMPKIIDHRDPRDIYQNLSLKRRKTKSWLLPSIAAVTALLLFFILVPKLWQGTNTSFDNAQGEKSSMSKDMGLDNKNNDSPVALKKENASSAEKAFDKTELMKTANIKTAVYEEEVGNGKMLTYWIPDRQVQLLIPISIIVPASKEKSWLTLFTENMAGLREEEWGLSDFYPLNLTVKLDENDNSIMVDVPKDHQYGQGSAMETTFMNALSKDISSNSNIKKVKFSTNGEPGIELGNYGHQEKLDIVQEKNHAFFFYYPEGNDIPFLTPSNATYNDINAALEAMKADEPILGLKSSLSPSLPIKDVSIGGNTLYVTIKDNSNLQDNQLTSSSYEALLLTAKEFGLEKVAVKNSPIPNIGPFDLSQEIKVPVAPNLRNIE